MTWRDTRWRLPHSPITRLHGRSLRRIWGKLSTSCLAWNSRSVKYIDYRSYRLETCFQGFSSFQNQRHWERAWSDPGPVIWFISLTIGEWGVVREAWNTINHTFDFAVLAVYDVMLIQNLDYHHLEMTTRISGGRHIGHERLIWACASSMADFLCAYVQLLSSLKNA